MKLNAPLSRNQVDALKECIDLLHNGYRESGSVVSGSTCVTVLRNANNGNKIMVVVDSESYTIYKNGTRVKTSTTVDDGTRYLVQIHSDGKMSVTRL